MSNKIGIITMTVLLDLQRKLPLGS